VKTDRIEKKLGESTQRHAERLALWKEIGAAWENGGPTAVGGLLREMATFLEQKKSKISMRLAEEMGVNNGDNQES